MAEQDPQFDVREMAPVPSRRSADGRLGRVLLMVSVPVLLVAGAVGYYLANERYVTTDNAYVHADKVSVSPQVAGNLVAVGVRENQQVHAGDLLFRIDPEPFRIAVAQAEAQIAAAQVKVIGLETDLSATGADIAGAHDSVGFYSQEYDRQAALMARGFTTRARFQQAEHDLSAARNKLANMQSEQSKARAALASAPAAPGVNPAVLAALVVKRKAELDLSRTEVRAPASGQVSQADKLEIGQQMFTGMPALTIVQTDRNWIEANFKETELAKMRVGQPATLSFDAYPGMDLKGHIASIGAGTGSEFSILPAQNASGNWVKVTQRVPVRIAIDQLPSRPLIAGMSTHVSIDTGR